MKFIKLSQGKFTKVDDEDFNWLNQWKWCALKSRNTFYAVRWDLGNIIYMHRLILNTPCNQQVDHDDFDGLNNQKYNIRNCTKSQNLSNKIPRGKSKYLGVSEVLVLNKYKYFKARITFNNTQILIGTYKNEVDAAYAYDKKAKEYHGEFANLNFK
jgi:hypothetical protein